MLYKEVAMKIYLTSNESQNSNKLQKWQMVVRQDGRSLSDIYTLTLKVNQLSDMMKKKNIWKKFVLQSVWKMFSRYFKINVVSVNRLFDAYLFIDLFKYFERMSFSLSSFVIKIVWNLLRIVVIKLGSGLPVTARSYQRYAILACFTRC